LLKDLRDFFNSLILLPFADAVGHLDSLLKTSSLRGHVAPILSFKLTHIRPTLGAFPVLKKRLDSAVGRSGC